MSGVLSATMALVVCPVARSGNTYMYAYMHMVLCAHVPLYKKAYAYIRMLLSLVILMFTPRTFTVPILIPILVPIPILVLLLSLIHLHTYTYTHAYIPTCIYVHTCYMYNSMCNA